jgi:hypothetical protein
MLNSLGKVQRTKLERERERERERGGGKGEPRLLSQFLLSIAFFRFLAKI